MEAVSERRPRQVTRQVEPLEERAHVPGRVRREGGGLFRSVYHDTGARAYGRTGARRAHGRAEPLPLSPHWRRVGAKFELSPWACRPWPRRPWPRRPSLLPCFTTPLATPPLAVPTFAPHFNQLAALGDAARGQGDLRNGSLYTGGAAIAAPLPVLLILSLPMAGQREELYSLKGATLPDHHAHPDTVVVDQQQLLNRNF